MFKEILGEAFPIVQRVAPIIATALGSPIAGSATMFGLNLLASAFGVNPSNIKSLENAIVTDPDAESRLGDLESQFSDWFQSNAHKFKMPLKAEINVKLEWQPT
jgi:hypothetical protein